MPASSALVLTLGLLAPTLAAQATILTVSTSSEAALAAAITAANAMAFQTSAAQPVVIEFAASLIGQTIALTQALPVLVVDHATVRVAGAGPAARVTLDATNAPIAFRTSSHHAVVRNLRFQNAGAPGSQQDVFTAFGTDDLRFEHCDFDAATGNALWLIGSTATTVTDCGFAQSASGLVAVGGTTGLTVLRCSFHGNQQGMLFAVADHVLVQDCVFDGNGRAVALQPTCADFTFGPGNVVVHTGNQPSFTAAGAVRLRLTGNQFTDNQHVAIQLRDLCADVTLSGNTLLRNAVPGNTYQVVVADCLGLLVTGLQCRDGGGGLFVTRTRLAAIAGSASAPVVITGNGREGLVLDSCSDVGVGQVTLSDNVRGIAGVQCAILGCQRVDISDTDITDATGAGDIGLRIDACENVRVGGGTSVLDHGGQGVLVDDSVDVVLGRWAGVTGSLTVRGATPLQIVDCARLQVAGSATAPCMLSAGPLASSVALTITRCFDGSYGPHLVVDGLHTASIAVQIADCNVGTFDGVTLRGHTGFGMVATGTTWLRVSGCLVDGGVGAPAATGEGLLLNPGCHGARLSNNLVQRQQGNAFVVRDCDDVWLGPGNRAIDNGGDGFVVQDTGTGPVVRRATIQSAVAVGRGVSAQNGFRCVRMRANLTNVTTTRNGTGVLLQQGSQATLVNTISWGNNLDRNRDAASTGTWLHGMRSTSAGTSSPGSWVDQDVLVGVDPAFLSAATGDVRLTPGSAAIDSGLHATPVGAGLPSVDADQAPRIRGGRIDRGAYEFPAASGNSLDLAGPWLRTSTQGQLDFTVRAGPSLAGQFFLLLLGGSGTGPGAIAPGGATVPLVPDPLTMVLLSLPSWCLGTLDGTGTGSVTVPLVPEVARILPELTFVAVVASSGTPGNPVVVRFLP
jgi:hypothetical protein